MVPFPELAYGIFEESSWNIFPESVSSVRFVDRYDAACLLLVYGVYIVVLCFDLRISEFVLRKLSPCCTCLGSGSGDKTETQPLTGWSDDTSLRVHSRSRTDSGIFQDDSGYSHLSLSLHGLNEIPEGNTQHLVKFALWGLSTLEVLT